MDRVKKLFSRKSPRGAKVASKPAATPPSTSVPPPPVPVEASPLLELPSDVWAHIFSFLHPTYLVRDVGPVSTAFHRWAWKALANTRVRMKWGYAKTLPPCDLLALKELDLVLQSGRTAFLAALQPSRQLHFLKLRSEVDLMTSTPGFAFPQSLERLEIDTPWFANCRAFLSGLPKLRALALAGMVADPEERDCSLPPSLSQLEELQLRWAPTKKHYAARNEMLQCLSVFTRLTSLTLRFSETRPLPNLRLISALTRLETLTLRGHIPADFAITPLMFPHLRSLTLGCQWSGMDPLELFLVGLLECSNLRMLDLRVDSLPDTKEVPHLFSPFTQLRKLRLRNYDVRLNRDDLPMLDYLKVPREHLTIRKAITIETVQQHPLRIGWLTFSEGERITLLASADPNVPLMGMSGRHTGRVHLNSLKLLLDDPYDYLLDELYERYENPQ